MDECFRRFGIACYINSADFERSDIYFDKHISPNLDKYTKDELSILLEGANKNNQVYWRKRSAKDDLEVLRMAAKKMDPDYDFSIYCNLPVDQISQPEDSDSILQSEECSVDEVGDDS